MLKDILLHLIVWSNLSKCSCAVCICVGVFFFKQRILSFIVHWVTVASTVFSSSGSFYVTASLLFTCVIIVTLHGTMGCLFNSVHALKSV